MSLQTTVKRGTRCKRAPAGGFPTHLGNHPAYDVTIKSEIDKVLKNNGVNPNNISSLTDSQITNMLDDIEDNALDVLENWVPSSLK